MKEMVEKRLEELIVKGNQIHAAGRKDRDDWYFYVNEEDARQWTMSALAILKSTLGEDGDNYLEVKKNLLNCGTQHVFGYILAYVKAALEDTKGGYFFDKQALIEAEVFDDLLEQSRELLSGGYKDAAAVLAGAVLERHLRSMCVRRTIDLKKPSGKPKAMNDLGDDLAKAGALNALKKKQITAWADLRNNAAHGHTTEYSKEDVESLVRDVSSFCANVS